MRYLSRYKANNKLAKHSAEMMDREKEDRNAADKGGGQWRGNKTQGVTNVESTNQVLTSVVILEVDQDIFVVMDRMG